jgi:hypothetical protein
MQNRTISRRHVEDVLRYDDVDVGPIEPFLISPSAEVRRFAVEIVAARGDINKVVEATKKEVNKQVVLTAFEYIWKAKEGLEVFTKYLRSEDSSFRQAVIAMFRRAGRADCLVTLLFDESDDLVFRVKEYMESEMLEKHAAYLTKLKRFRILLKELSDLCDIMEDTGLSNMVNALLHELEVRILDEEATQF